MRRRALTILEVVVTLALASMILVVMYSVLSHSTRGVRHGQERLDTLSDFNRTVEWLRRDVRALFWREEHPILMDATTEAVELWFDQVQGVSLEGLPMVVPVVWRFRPGAPGGTLERIFSPESAKPSRREFFSGELRSFRVVKLDGDGRVLDGADPTPPAYLECHIDHALGERLRIRLFLYSRYNLRSIGETREAHWLPNHRLESLPPAFPFLTPYHDGVVFFASEQGRLRPGALVTSGDRMQVPQ